MSRNDMRRSVPMGEASSLRLCGIVALLIGCIIPLAAQWIPTNTPPNFTPTVLAVDDSNLYAGYAAGLLCSHDRGATWKQAGKGLPAERITALKIRRVVGGSMLFAGTQSQGIFLSIDNGSSWNTLDQAPVVETERQAAVLGAKAYYGGPTVFALTMSGRFLFAGMNFGGVFRSTNDGGSWSVANDGFTSSAPSGPPSITALSVSGEYIFAGTTGDGVFLSTNNGRQWVGMSNGLPADGRSIYSAVNAFASIPKERKTDGEYVFVATQGAGVYLTADDGRRWVPINNGLREAVVYSLAVWTGEGQVGVFAGAADGVYLRATNSPSWRNVTTGMPQARVYSLAVAGDTLYAAVSRNGVWKRSIRGMMAERPGMQ